MKKIFRFLLTVSACSLLATLHGRELPKPYIDRAIQVFKENKGAVIVELGSMFKKVEHDIDTGRCVWCMSGHSTLLWARTLATVYSVDVNSAASETAREACASYKNVKVITADGIEFLKKFDKKIDLLYLDAWDVSPGTPFAEKHLEAYEAAKNKLSPKGLVLIDDYDIQEGGKGKLVVPQALKDGFKIVFSGRQILLAR